MSHAFLVIVPYAIALVMIVGGIFLHAVIRGLVDDFGPTAGSSK